MSEPVNDTNVSNPSMAEIKNIGIQEGTPKSTLEKEKENTAAEGMPAVYEPEVKTSKLGSSKFKEAHTFEQRKAESNRILKKYTDRIPIIVEKNEKSDIKDIDKKKFLAPPDLTVGQFMYVVRKRINLAADTAIFLFVENTIPSTAQVLGETYANHKDEDGFLYVVYSGESTFG